MMPPPPREDSEAFVQRVKAVYMDKILHDAEKANLLTNLDSTTKPIPEWVYTSTQTIPFIASILVAENFKSANNHAKIMFFRQSFVQN